MKNVILASASPRRREIMNKLRVPYKVIVSNVQEKRKTELGLEEQIMDISNQKAMAVFKDHQDDLIIGADTIVEIDGEVLGKPHSLSEAREMIKKLSARTHRVITAVTIVTAEETWSFADTAYVTFEEIEDSEIEKYINTKEPYDKAGGYAIQGWASIFISKINGSYFTVMGFPLHVVAKKLKELGYTVV